MCAQNYKKKMHFKKDLNYFYFNLYFDLIYYVCN